MSLSDIHPRAGLPGAGAGEKPGTERFSGLSPGAGGGESELFAAVFGEMVAALQGQQLAAATGNRVPAGSMRAVELGATTRLVTPQQPVGTSDASLLAFARAQGLDPEQVASVLRETPAAADEPAVLNEPTAAAALAAMAMAPAGRGETGGLQAVSPQAVAGSMAPFRTASSVLDTRQGSGLVDVRAGQDAAGGTRSGPGSASGARTVVAPVVRPGLVQNTATGPGEWTATQAVTPAAPQAVTPAAPQVVTPAAPQVAAQAAAQAAALGATQAAPPLVRIVVLEDAGSAETADAGGGPDELAASTMVSAAGDERAKGSPGARRGRLASERLDLLAQARQLPGATLARPIGALMGRLTAPSPGTSTAQALDGRGAAQSGWDPARAGSPEPAAGAANRPAGAESTGSQALEAVRERYELLAQRLGEAIGQRLAAQIARGEWRLRLELSPAHLGRIDVDLGMQDGELQATFHASQALTRELLQEGLPRLRQELERSGMDVAGMGVDSRGAGASGGNSTHRHVAPGTGGDSGPSDPISTDAATVPRGPSGEEGLDILV
jgi:hypothetical protein